VQQYRGIEFDLSRNITKPKKIRLSAKPKQFQINNYTNYCALICKTLLCGRRKVERQVKN
jgi:hypothetical protein